MVVDSAYLCLLFKIHIELWREGGVWRAERREGGVWRAERDVRPVSGV